MMFCEVCPDAVDGRHRAERGVPVAWTPRRGRGRYLLSGGSITAWL